ncbi:MAG TPA: VWA domain-containing protein [Pyrinomonadaceae bacterium]|nr:VWA domain-containing protein [Pyrinomonadaceae bacterium]
MKKRVVLAVVLIVSQFAASSGQQQQDKPKDEVVKITTNLVQLDLVVTDKDGKHIVDLKPEDFEIREDGKEQRITNFSYVTAASSTPSSDGAATSASAETGSPRIQPARLPREQVRRTYALVVDDLGLSFESLSYVRDALTKFVAEQMQPNDLVAVLRTSGGIGVLQQFTSDRRQLNAAIESVRWVPTGRAGISSMRQMNEQSIGADIRDSIQFTEEMEESRAGQFSVGTLGALNAIVDGMRDMPGRKSMVVISEALRMFSAQGRNTQLIQALRQLTDLANANSVAIYTLDASGLQTYTFEASDRVAGYSYVIDPQLLAASGGVGGTGVTPNPPPRTLTRADSLSAQAEQDSGAAFRRLGALMNQREQQQQESHTVLSYLAQRTGGLFLRNRNDVGAGIKRILDDQQGFYLIGYRPDELTISPKSGARVLRNLEVKIKRSGLRARTRAGYFGISDEVPAAERRTREEQMTAAIISPFARNEIGLRLTSLFGDEPGGGTYMRSLLHIDASHLEFKKSPEGAHTAELEMLAVAFGDNGQVVDQFGYPQSVKVDSDADYQEVLKNGLIYVLNFPIKRGGPYQMRVAVRDGASERVGAAMQFVEAPDLSKNRLVLSGIVLSAVEAETEPQAGPAVRRLRQGMTLDYRYIVYNANPGGVQGGPQLETQMRLFRDGQPVFTGRTLKFDATGQTNLKRLSAAGRLRLGPELSPGNYVLQVTVTDTLAPQERRTALQWIDFEISK